MPKASPTFLNDIRSLALLLSPSEKVQSSEVADLTSGLAAYINYGDDILTAAEKGAQGIADFFHDKITDKAKADGVPDAELPKRGASVENVQTRQAPSGYNTGVNQSDLDKLKAEIFAGIKDLLHPTETDSTAPAPAPVEPVDDGTVS